MAAVSAVPPRNPAAIIARDGCAKKEGRPSWAAFFAFPIQLFGELELDLA
jgi:hypothetical protein